LGSVDRECCYGRNLRRVFVPPVADADVTLAWFAGRRTQTCMALHDTERAISWHVTRFFEHEICKSHLLSEDVFFVNVMVALGVASVRMR